MRLNIYTLLFTVVFCTLSISSMAQMIKAPTKPTDTKKKPVTKPVIKLKDDDDDKADSAASGNFAYMIIKSNKGSAINVNINDNESGKIRAGMSKKIPINNSDELRIALNDGQGNLYDTTFTVDDKDAGKNIVISFPEIDYAAIRAEEARIRRENEERLRLIREEEARKLREAQEEELRKIREAEEALRLERIGLLNVAENEIKQVMQQALSDKMILQEQIESIKKGELVINETVTKQYDTYLAERNVITEKLKVYTDSSLSYNMKEKKDEFFRQIKTDQDKLFKDEFYTFIPSVFAGKIPMSANVLVAFKASRPKDIPFFVGLDSLADGTINGKRIIQYALDAGSDASVFKFLFENGVSPNNFALRFPENKDIYASPLSSACIQGNLDVIKEFIAKEAALFPPSLSKLEKKKQVKFLLTKFGDKTDVLNLLKESKYDMDDGTAAILAAINFIDSSMVVVEGGEFTMGCPNQMSAECASDEKPAIQVTVSDFKISKFEVPQRVWIAIMDDENPSFFKDCLDCPVEMVSWKAVSEFIERLNKFSEKKYRLPTEAEWEFAARGGKMDTKEFLYAGSKDINEVAWYKDNSNKPSPIGTKKPNALGLYDMSGSVSEWCNDYYSAEYFTRSTLINPKGPEVSAQRVIRGGSFMQSSWSSRLSNREGRDELFNNNNTGFRLAMDK